MDFLCYYDKWQPKRTHPFISNHRKGMVHMYVTYSDLFAFVMVIFTVVTFICNQNGVHKK